MKPKLEINSSGNSAEILIYDVIGDFWGETDAKSFAENISSLDVAELTVRVNSPGGDAFDGIAIMNALKRHPAKVTAYVDGRAASAASVIVVGGADEVVMCTGSQLMIHDAMIWAGGNAAELEKARAHVEKLSDDMAAVYAAKAGTPKEEWRESMREETWFTASEAIDVGLADRIDSDTPADLNAVAMMRNPVSAQFKYSGREQAPVPAMLATKKRKGPAVGLLENVAKKLGMPTNGLDESTVLAALDEVLQEQEVEETSGPDSVEKVKQAEEALSAAHEETDEEATVQVGEVTLEVNVFEDLKRRAALGDAAEAENSERKADEFVTAAIKEGRILAAKKADWIALALDDFEATKAKILTFASGTIAVSEKGRGGSDASRSTATNHHKSMTESFLTQTGLK